MADKICTPRSTAGLRDMLFAELDAFRAGKSSTKRAQIIVNYARTIIDTTRLEIVNSAMLLEQRKHGTPTLTLK